MKPLTTQSTTARPASPMPAQVNRSKTRPVAQSVTEPAISTTISSVPVSQAAAGSRVNPNARRPLAAPRRRNAIHVQMAPATVSAAVSAAQVVPSTAPESHNAPRLRDNEVVQHDDHGPAGGADDLVRTIPDPGFADDSGAGDPRVARALADHAAGGVSSGTVLSLLQDARLLVPVVAVLGEVELDERGLAHDKSSDMAAVLVRAADGSKGLLAFTSTETMARWDPEARPVPVTTGTAATAAVQDGAEALLVDLAGPAPYVVDGEDLARLAAGWRLVGLTGTGAGRHGWIGPSAE